SIAAMADRRDPDRDRGAQEPVARMVDDNPHRAAARRWVDCAAAELPPERALRNFEAAFDVLWQRANRTLSDVTLMAILDRVLHDATVRFPLLSPLEIDPKGLRCTG